MSTISFISSFSSMVLFGLLCLLCLLLSLMVSYGLLLCSLKSILGFLLSECTSEVSPVLFLVGAIYGVTSKHIMIFYRWQPSSSRLWLTSAPRRHRNADRMCAALRTHAHSSPVPVLCMSVSHLTLWPGEIHIPPARSLPLYWRNTSFLMAVYVYNIPSSKRMNQF